MVKQLLLDSAWAGDVRRATDGIFRRLFMGLCRLSLLAKEEQTLTIQASISNVADAISDMFCSIVDSIHISSETFNKEPQLSRSRDIRTDIVSILRSFISTLDGEDELQAGVLESMIYVIVEATGKCLCVPAATNDHDTEAKKRALQESSTYVLQLLKAALPLYREQLANNSVRGGSEGIRNATPVMELVKNRFHDYIMKGLFGESKTPAWKDLKSFTKGLVTKGTWGGVGIQNDFVFVDEEGFAEEVWKLLELEDFTLVW
ncbi:hypothetical protein ABW20_dc0109496 [Dactylellina cionopaga]|nr:hypothetical protein ABW20_dc0109496 [Dactylellina cionopaga]